MDNATPPHPIEHQPGPGRPRGFDKAAALEAGMQLFWRQGYDATSLDMLTEAMGISRSSFYACFGTKRDVLLAALRSYSLNRRAAIAAVGTDATTLLAAIAGPSQGPDGCLMVNCIAELAPQDPEIAALARAHLAFIERRFAAALSPGDPAAAADRASALLALALGVLTMRKGGVDDRRIAATLQAARALISPG